MLKRVNIIFSIVAILICLPLVHADDLYGTKGIAPEAVRQGRLGSCYFHAVIAAIAQRRPDSIRNMIQTNPDGSYTVTFGDGKKETAYPEDLKYTHQSGYDLSDGEWVAVLFRTYAQRVLRDALLQAIDSSDMFPMLKSPAEQIVATSDQLVLAYDRAIRSQVDQYGNIDRAKLETGLKNEMAPMTAIPDSMKDSFIGMLASGGFFEKMSSIIQQNGELFGAYRAVGQGGIADRVMKTFSGSNRYQENDSESKVNSALSNAIQKEMPIVACTGGSVYYNNLAKGQSLPPDTDAWYINAHCYTVLNYDSGSRMISLRNPWARHPDPDGIFNLPLSTFVPAFAGLVTPE